MRVGGFTLIELLIVIAIIGVLSATVLVSLNIARSKARDAARIAAVQEVQKAIELYFLANGHYPSPEYPHTPYINASTIEDCGYLNDWCDFEAALAPYIKKLPRDESSEPVNRRYLYKSNSPYSTYGLRVVLENALPAAATDGGFDPLQYEVGPLPKYCTQKYTGVYANWTNWDGGNLCVGGN